MATLQIPADAFIHSCLENVTRLIPGSLGVYYRVDEQLVPQHYVLAGIPAQTHRAYLEHFCPQDPFHPRRYDPLPVSFAFPDAQLRHTPYYRHFMQPNNMADMAEIFVRKNRHIVAGLSLMRDTPFTPQERMRLRAMLPLVELATEELLPVPGDQRLTPKEQVIVDLIREGACNKRIAHHLNISLSTVKTHLRNIFTKAEVSNRTELLRNVGASWYAGPAS